jgi:hypothetical protein
MASLTLYHRFRSLKAIQFFAEGTSEESQNKAKEIVEALSRESSNATLIRLESVFNDLAEKASGTGTFFEQADWYSLPPIAIPYRLMWFECVYGKSKTRRSVLCRRGERDGGGWDLHMMGGVEADNIPGLIIFPTNQVLIQTDAHGQITEYDEDSPFEDGDENELLRDFGRQACYAAANALARLNCKNVRLSEPDRSRKKSVLPVIPMSYWHEIVLSEKDTPQPGRENGEHREIRLHWVRGHFADYRIGSGLFGRIKAVFWIPEHRRGNPDIGTVVSNYAVTDTGPARFLRHPANPRISSRD